MITLINKAVASNLVWASGVSSPARLYQSGPIFTDRVESCQTWLSPGRVKHRFACLKPGEQEGLQGMRAPARATDWPEV